jgi:RNA polymerase sigma factor (sigma-70 family)
VTAPRREAKNDSRPHLLYLYCRVQRPGVRLPWAAFAGHMRRMFDRARTTVADLSWERFLHDLHPLDAFVAAACLENLTHGWHLLFAARTGRSDRLLVDALRQRAARLFPHDEEQQETAVTDFWGHLLLAPTAESLPILARYDGQRPLVPWLIRVFQNRLISQLRSPSRRAESLAEDDLLADHDVPAAPTAHWHEAFCDAARAWLARLPDQDALVLGLRWRYRLSQREVAEMLSVHEGTVSRQITHLRDNCYADIDRTLQEAGWTGDDLHAIILNEMAGVLLDEPRLAAENLGRMMAARGYALPDKVGAG